MFSWAFAGTSITSIPSNLFSGVSGCQDNVFGSTFNGCTSLTYIPENLFSGINCAYNYQFGRTFYNCTNLSGYIPPSTFSGLINAGHPKANNLFADAFYGTKLVTSCPSGTTQYISGYEGSGTRTWNGKVSCQSTSGIISLTWDGVATTPTSCTLGSTFVPPTPAARPGYRFTGWKVKTINP